MKKEKMIKALKERREELIAICHEIGRMISIIETDDLLDKKPRTPGFDYDDDGCPCS